MKEIGFSSKQGTCCICNVYHGQYGEELKPGIVIEDTSLKYVQEYHETRIMIEINFKEH